MGGTGPHITAAELRVMKVLWTIGSGTVRNVLDALPCDGDEPPAYTTVMTVMSRLSGFMVFYTPEPGKERYKKFLIPRRQLGDKLVEAEYFRQACEFRKEQEKLGYGLELFPDRGCKRGSNGR